MYAYPVMILMFKDSFDFIGIFQKLTKQDGGGGPGGCGTYLPRLEKKTKLPTIINFLFIKLNFAPPPSWLIKMNFAKTIFLAHKKNKTGQKKEV